MNGSAELRLYAALLAALAGAQPLAATFGAPARVFDRARPDRATPQLVLGEMISRDMGAAEAPGTEHRIRLQVLALDGSRRQVLDAIGALTGFLQGLTLQAEGLSVVSLQVVASAAGRLEASGACTGALDVLIHTEPAD